MVLPDADCANARSVTMASPVSMPARSRSRRCMNFLPMLCCSFSDGSRNEPLALTHLADIRQILAISGQDLTFERLQQRQIAIAASKGRSKPRVDGTGTLTRADWPTSRHAPPFATCRTGPLRRSCRRGRCPQLGDQRQNPKIGDQARPAVCPAAKRLPRGRLALNCSPGGGRELDLAI